MTSLDAPYKRRTLVVEVETMTTKEARLELRLDERSKEHIVRAAELSNESVSSFVLLAAAAAADKVLARASYTVMPADQFDELLAALDLPEEAPTLVQTGQRTRRYRRR